jgi:hypothetical protein
MIVLVKDVVGKVIKLKVVSRRWLKELVGWRYCRGRWLRRSMGLVAAGFGVVRIFLDGFLSRGDAAWECVSSQGWEGNYFIKMVGFFLGRKNSLCL